MTNPTWHDQYMHEAGKQEGRKERDAEWLAAIDELMKEQAERFGVGEITGAIIGTLTVLKARMTGAESKLT